MKACTKPTLAQESKMKLTRKKQIKQQEITRKLLEGAGRALIKLSQQNFDDIPLYEIDVQLLDIDGEGVQLRHIWNYEEECIDGEYEPIENISQGEITFTPDEEWVAEMDEELENETLRVSKRLLN